MELPYLAVYHWCSKFFIHTVYIAILRYSYIYWRVFEGRKKHDWILLLLFYIESCGRAPVLHACIFTQGKYIDTRVSREQKERQCYKTDPE